MSSRRRRLCLPLLVLVPALALAGCGSKPSDDLDSMIARAEAAAVRAENAQKGAEAAAARAENDKIAAASEDVDLAKPEPVDAAREELEQNANASRSASDSQSNGDPG